MTIWLGIFGDETKKSLFVFVIGTIRYPMEWVLMQNLLGFGLLNRHAIDWDGQFSFGHFIARWTRFSFFQLVIELEFLNALFHHFDAFGLVDFDITKKLQKWPKMKKRNFLSQVMGKRATFHQLCACYSMSENPRISFLSFKQLYVFSTCENYA